MIRSEKLGLEDIETSYSFYIIGVIYHNKKDYELAVHFYSKALEIFTHFKMEEYVKG